MERVGSPISTKRTVNPCVPLSIPKTALGLALQEGDDDDDDDDDVMLARWPGKVVGIEVLSSGVTNDWNGILC